MKGQYNTGISGTYRAFRRGIYLLAVVYALQPAAVFAADISLNVSVAARDEQVTVKVTNTGRDNAVLLRVSTELAGEKYGEQVRSVLEPGKQHNSRMQVKFPEREGSYPLITRVFYLNDGKELSIVDAGYFNYRRTEHLADNCAVPNISLAGKTVVELPKPENYRFTLVLPDEIKVEEQLNLGTRVRYVLQSLHPQFTSNYAVFTVVQTPPEFMVQATRICSTRLVTTQILERRSFIPGWFICCAGVLGLALSWAQLRKTAQRCLVYGEVVAARYGFSVFLVSCIYLFFRNAYRAAQLVEPYVYLSSPSSGVGRYLLSAVQVLLRWLYFHGRDYDQFFNWVADPLYVYMLSANGFVLYYLVRPDQESDKYYHLMRSFFSMWGLRRLFCLRSETAFCWTARTRLALLSIAVKAFYLPLLASWSINQAGYVYRLLASAHWQLYAINSAVVEILIFVDVVIFFFGYLTELPLLKNTIRSVEPTVLGWFVCLMCYPPFNSFSFSLFDQPLNEYWTPAFGMAHALAAGAITVLWAIYVWATIALGFKSSNLTNRGIVDRGPYRFTRHPAYAAKVSLWMLSSFFMGEKNFFLVIAFVVVYALRAWTEERHLSRDPDYLEYKKKVPWVLIPQVL